ncbi:lysophospholipid acyltransferase family protein [Caenimonas koreensis]|uniref:lysophospholipid acyltransferase family protein n=1 Tax=Caenimonas koreensis TaxID=367474 RepID=UPI003784F0B8
MKLLRAVWTALRVIAQVLSGVGIILTQFKRIDQPAREAHVQAWANRMLGALGITLEVRGEPVAQGPTMMVANHISWLDILVMHGARYCRFVSKADVKHWPLIGTLATGAGTIYIERESRRDALRVVHHIAESLQRGEVVGVFPEGTTSDGLGLLPFHANIIQAAIAAHAPVQPVALQYVDSATRGASLTPCYVGDDTLVGSVWKLLTGAPVTAVVSFGAPQQSQGRDRRAWAADLRTAVGALRQT